MFPLASLNTGQVGKLRRPDTRRDAGPECYAHHMILSTPTREEHAEQRNVFKREYKDNVLKDRKALRIT